MLLKCVLSYIIYYKKKINYCLRSFRKQLDDVDADDEGRGAPQPQSETHIGDTFVDAFDVRMEDHEHADDATVHAEQEVVSHEEQTDAQDVADNQARDATTQQPLSHR